METLVKRLILNPSLVGIARQNELTRLIKLAISEWNDFTNKRKKMDLDKTMWSLATDLEEHRWYQSYMIPKTVTKVLGPLGCLVLSKVLGSGSAERLWKIKKMLKSGQRSSLGIEKAKKQALIYARYQESRAKLKVAKQSAAGTLWEDEDFKCCKMNEFCQEIVDGLPQEEDQDEGGVRVLRAWQEGWEKRKVGPQGDSIFQARLVRKYGGLCWTDPDHGDTLRTAHPDQMFFQKKKGNNQYHVFAMKDGYDRSRVPDKQDEEWDVWAFDMPLYDQITEYYEDKEGVVVYQEGEDCESEEE